MDNSSIVTPLVLERTLVEVEVAVVSVLPTWGGWVLPRPDLEWSLRPILPGPPLPVPMRLLVPE
jgi:hypothetical protein